MPEPPAPRIQTQLDRDRRLLQAAAAAARDLMEQALRDGADVDAKDSFKNMTPAHWAAYHGDPACMRLLIEAGADIHAQDEHGITAAMFASMNSREACLRLLIEAGADINAHDADGDTAALFAAKWGRDGCLRLLIDACADLDARNHEGASAADLAQASGHLHLACWLRAVQLAASERGALLQAGLAPHPEAPAAKARL